MEATKDNKKDFGNYQKLLDEKVLPGLAEYFDTRRMPEAYASYIKDAPLSDRFTMTTCGSALTSQTSI